MSRACNTVTRARHGLTHTPEFCVWVNMVYRCRNPHHHAYRHYGGRGIKVCQRWLRSFTAFLADMGPRLSKVHQIDRINNDGNYEPGNCRWATKQQQANNRRTTRMISFRGKRQPLKTWAEELGITEQSMSFRLAKWSKVRALTTPRGGRLAT